MDAHEATLIPTVPAKTREQDPMAQARPNPSKKRKAKHTFPPVAEKLLATSGCWENKDHFLKKVQPDKSTTLQCNESISAA